MTFSLYGPHSTLDLDPLTNCATSLGCYSNVLFCIHGIVGNSQKDVSNDEDLFDIVSISICTYAIESRPSLEL